MTGAQILRTPPGISQLAARRRILGDPRGIVAALAIRLASRASCAGRGDAHRSCTRDGGVAGTAPASGDPGLFNLRQ